MTKLFSYDNWTLVTMIYRQQRCVIHLEFCLHLVMSLFVAHLVDFEYRSWPNIMLLQYHLQVNIIFWHSEVQYNFHRSSRGNRPDIMSSRYKPGLGMTITAVTAGSQGVQTEPGEWITSSLLCFVNPAVSKERGSSNLLRTSTTFRNGMGLVLDPRWYVVITGSLYHTHTHTCTLTSADTQLPVYTPSLPMYTHTGFHAEMTTYVHICTHGQLCEIL